MVNLQKAIRVLTEYEELDVVPTTPEEVEKTAYYYFPCKLKERRQA
ncbi:hypothetical protein [Alkalihalobacterium chitinilyticum]|uniref:Uncharacterized protein n=1 Tax=Alkalihalobacterium chitinilyticum TaxID=2980103 RepID=A0ABT5V942_9BACI|nr:hypothetical protein [Alkalihalobacterium chitinilyticum]MDE5411982.1 hypothetical protein [Alkalihalobacterium chitinilyticum]